MYKEDTVTTKARAMALARLGFLFWHDANGAARVASVDKVKTSWGIWHFFACTHAKPKGFVS